MTQRILFLDDCPSRRKWAKRTFGPGNHLVLTEDATGCIEELRLADPYDVVYLDHDLGGETYVDPSVPNTGSGVVRWIVEHKPRVGKFVVHSLNAPAANYMVADLRDAGYEAEYVNFLILVQRG